VVALKVPKQVAVDLKASMEASTTDKMWLLNSFSICPQEENWLAAGSTKADSKGVTVVFAEN
jgi:hypothetical protein